jgi:hypothetical protein
MPQIKGHRKPIKKAANVGSIKIGQYFFKAFPTITNLSLNEVKNERGKKESPARWILTVYKRCAD